MELVLKRMLRWRNLKEIIEVFFMYLYGASGHAKVIAEILLENGIEIEGVFDDDTSFTSFFNLPFLGTLSDMDLNSKLIVSIGDNVIRKTITQKLSTIFGKAISKNAHISSSASIDEGTVIMKGVSINADTTIGKHVILNTNCSIDHDCRIGDYVHVSPNAALAGNVIVKEGTHIGTGVCIIPGIIIGNWTTIGAGTVVLKNVPDNAVVVGNPGRIIKYK